MPTGTASASITTATAKQQGTSALSIQRGADSGQARRPSYPIAPASLYRPVPGRRMWWLSIRCPRCAGVHLGRLRPESEPGGKRRVPCGTVYVVVRRTYGTSPEAAA